MQIIRITLREKKFVKSIFNFFFSDVLNVNTGDSSPPPTLDHKRPQPRGFVRLKINERAARIAMWLNQNFLVQDGEVVADEHANLPKVSFLCMRNRPNVNIFSKKYCLWPFRQ